MDKLETLVLSTEGKLVNGSKEQIIDNNVDKKSMTKYSHKKLSKMVFKKELEKIEGKPQSSETEKNVLQGNQRFTKNETELIFQHFKHYLDTETLPKKQDIVLFMNKTSFQAEEVGWHDIKGKIKTKQQNMRKKEANRIKKLKRKFLERRPKCKKSIRCETIISPQKTTEISNEKSDIAPKVGFNSEESSNVVIVSVDPKEKETSENYDFNKDDTTKSENESDENSDEENMENSDDEYTEKQTDMGKSNFYFKILPLFGDSLNFGRNCIFPSPRGTHYRGS